MWLENRVLCMNLTWRWKWILKQVFLLLGLAKLIWTLKKVAEIFGTDVVVFRAQFDVVKFWTSLLVSTRHIDGPVFVVEYQWEWCRLVVIGELDFVWLLHMFLNFVRISDNLLFKIAKLVISLAKFEKLISKLRWAIAFHLLTKVAFHLVTNIAELSISVRRSMLLCYWVCYRLR